MWLLHRRSRYVGLRQLLKFLFRLSYSVLLTASFNCGPCDSLLGRTKNPADDDDDGIINYNRLTSILLDRGRFQRERLGTAFPKLFWQWEQPTAFKPTLDELYKKHSVCTKIHLFKIQNRKIFLERGHSPLLRPGGEGDTPSPRLTPSAPSAPRSSRLRRSNSAFPKFFLRKRPLISGLRCRPKQLQTSLATGIGVTEKYVCPIIREISRDHMRANFVIFYTIMIPVWMKIKGCREDCRENRKRLWCAKVFSYDVTPPLMLYTGRAKKVSPLQLQIRYLWSYIVNYFFSKIYSAVFGCIQKL